MIINFISGPRNISTAMMYSFAQRSDTKVVDEPFYAHYLVKTQLDHPGREEVLASMSANQNTVLAELSQLERQHPVVFLKNMAHHHIGLDWSYLHTMKNVFLIRDPHQLIASFAQVIAQPTLQDIGLKEEAELFEYVAAHGKHPPLVIDTNAILSNPEKGLRSLCERLGIPLEKSMLRWKKGPIKEDGVWAKYWYHNVHDSTGFAKQPTSSRPLPENCVQLYEEALPYYQKLQAHL